MSADRNDILPHEMTVQAPGANWNEIHFVSRDEFIAVAPAIVQLEIRRLDELLRDLDLGSNLYNTVIAARYHLRRLVAEQNALVSIPSQCSKHLEAAIMSVSVPPKSVEKSILATLSYVQDRLGHVLEQMTRLY